ncbi:unnamed protein product, partial [Didymodactylos carnosus]
PTEIKQPYFEQKIPGLTSTNNDEDEVNVADIFKAIPCPKILDFIFGSESYLTDKRNTLTGNHHENGRNTVKEIYTAVCGQLLVDIHKSFNAYVVMNMQKFNELQSNNNKNSSLLIRIMKMSDQEVGTLANININEIKQSLKMAHDEIHDLLEARIAIEIAIEKMRNPHITENELRHLEQQKRKHLQAESYYLDREQKKVEKELRKRPHTTHSLSIG